MREEPMPHQERTAAQQRFIDDKITDVLADENLPADSKLRGLLDLDATVFDAGREFGICVVRPGRDISLAERLKELKTDVMFKHHFQAARPKVDKRDLRTMAEHFDEILTGKVRVE
jgi:hypothetical protein